MTLWREFNASEQICTTDPQLKRRVCKALKIGHNTKKNKNRKKKKASKQEVREDTATVYEEEFGALDLNAVLQETFADLQNHNNSKTNNSSKPQ